MSFNYRIWNKRFVGILTENPPETTTRPLVTLWFKAFLHKINAIMTIYDKDSIFSFLYLFMSLSTDLLEDKQGVFGGIW